MAAIKGPCLLATFLAMLMGCVSLKRRQPEEDTPTLPTCEMKCHDVGYGTWFHAPAHGPLPMLHKRCDVTSNVTNICELPLSEIYSNYTNAFMFYHKFDCTGHGKLRVLFTNPWNIKRDVLSYLHLESCDVSLFNLGIYGQAVDLRVVYLMNYTDVDDMAERSLHLNNRTKGDGEGNALDAIPGLENVVTLHLSSRKTENMSMPHSLYSHKWPTMGELTLEDIITHPSEITALQRSMPNLQTLKLINSTTSVPVDFPWNPKPLALPRNLSRTDAINDLYCFVGALGWDLEPHLFCRAFHLENNGLKDLSTVQFRGILHMISVSKNKIKNLGPDTFTQVKELQILKLDSNLLRELPAGGFRTLSVLKRLDLSHNRIVKITAAVFEGLDKLEILDMNDNNLLNIPPKTFSPLSILKQLNLSKNAIQETAKDAIGFNMHRIKTVDLGYNDMRHFPEWIFTTRSLTNVTLSRNKMSFEILARDCDVLDIEKIILYNKDTGSSSNFKPRQEKIINLSHNNFTSLNTGLLSVGKRMRVFKTIIHFFKLDLGGNDIDCDCHTYSMQKFLKAERAKSISSSYEKFRVLDFAYENWKCFKPEAVRGKPIVEVRNDTFKCQKDLEDCPPGCRCFEIIAIGKIDVDCSGRNLTHLPATVPNNTRDLLFSHNALVTVTDAKYLRSLRILDLSSNKIETVNTDAVASFDHIHTVLLHDNSIKYIPVEFRHLENVQLTLDRNNIVCDCHSKWLVRWIFSYKSKIQDIEKVTCSSGIPQKDVIYKAKEEEFICRIPRKVIVAIAITLPIVMLLAIALLYKYRGEIKVLIYFHFKWHPFDRSDDADVVDKLYDAFVSYSRADVNWVLNTLRPALETPKSPYRLCIHERDFKPGGLITDNVLYSVKYSRRMIMVLTRDFLKSEWCRLEFKSAHRRVLKDRTNYLIVILFDGLDIEDLDEDMKLYLRTNTYIEHESKWFWRRLTYAMPQTPLAILRGQSFPSAGYSNLFPTPLTVAQMQQRENDRILSENPSATVPEVVLDKEFM